METLTAENEIEEIDDAIDGAINDDATVERLVNENLPLAKFFANKAMDIDYDEAFSRAMHGLHRAAQRFDDTRGCRFGAFAGFIIKQQLHRVRQFRNTAKRGRGTVTFSLEAPASETNESTLRDTLVDPRADAIGNIDDEANHSVVLEALAQLPDRERAIISRRFGIGGDAETLEEIGIDYSLTRERVRQLEAIALKKLHRLISEIRDGAKKAEMIEEARAVLAAAA